MTGRDRPSVQALLERASHQRTWGQQVAQGPSLSPQAQWAPFLLQSLFFLWHCQQGQPQGSFLCSLRLTN